MTADPLVLNATDSNPFRAPQVGEQLRYPEPSSAPLLQPELVDQAVHSIKVFEAEEGSLQDDDRQCGPRIQRLNYIFLASMLIFIPVWDKTFAEQWLGIMILVMMGIAGVSFCVLVAKDFFLPRRHRIVQPEAALCAFFRSAIMGRTGYFRSLLAPSARCVEEPAPRLDPVPSCYGRYCLDSAAGLKSYLRSWSGFGEGGMRWLRIGKIESQHLDNDRWLVRAHITVSSLPAWANNIAVLLLLVQGIGAVIYGLLYLLLRQKRSWQVQKYVVRGESGRLYIVSPRIDDAPYEQALPLADP